MATASTRLAIVDDHRMLLTALSTWIRSAADDIDLVASVSTWPDLLAHPGFPVDVVLLDLDLRDDLPISVKLRALDTVGVRTVVMSSYSEPAVVAQAMASGAMGYIVKSERATTIVEAIRAAMAGERFVSEGLRAAAETDPTTPALSPQERRVLALFAAGEPIKRIATILHISHETAKSHLRRIRSKYRVMGIDVGTQLGLRDEAIRSGLILLAEQAPGTAPAPDALDHARG